MAKRIYNPRLTSARQRDLAKLAELEGPGEHFSLSKLQRLRRAYEQQGLLGLVDQRLIRRDPVAGQTDQRVVDAVVKVLEHNTHQSTGTMDPLMRQVREQLESKHGPGIVPFPSRATLQPEAPFGAVYPVRPGKLMQIDPTPLDIAVELDDGVIGRVELTAMVDIATRSIPAAVIRPATKAVDAALLLARCLTPEPMRPGWANAASMAASALPAQPTPPPATAASLPAGPACTWRTPPTNRSSAPAMVSGLATGSPASPTSSPSVPAR